MKKWWINGLAMLMAGAMTVFAVGCGDDDDKGNNSDTELTEEQQYAYAQALMSAAPGLMVQNFGSQFWDGVDQEDFTFSFFGLGKMVPPHLGKAVPVLAKPIQLEADTVIFGYNAGTGWWKFHVEFSFDDDTSGISVSLLLDDSVRFQTDAGVPQLEPNDNTSTFFHQGDLTLEVSIDADSLGVFAVAIGGENDFSVTGLNEDFVTVNGSTDAAIDFELDTDSVTADIEMQFLGEVEDVVTANVPESCPDDGLLTLDFEMDFVVEQGDETASASGDWAVQVDLTGEGMAHITVQSGDFEAEGDEFICDPPL